MSGWLLGSMIVSLVSSMIGNECNGSTCLETMDVERTSSFSSRGETTSEPASSTPCDNCEGTVNKQSPSQPS